MSQLNESGRGMANLGGGLMVQRLLSGPSAQEKVGDQGGNDAPNTTLLYFCSVVPLFPCSHRRIEVKLAHTYAVC